MSQYQTSTGVGCVWEWDYPQPSLEWLWISEVVFHIVQAPLFPSHHTSWHVPHGVYQAANLFDALDWPTGPEMGGMATDYTNIPIVSNSLQGYTNISIFHRGTQTHQYLYTGLQSVPLVYRDIQTYQNGPVSDDVRKSSAYNNTMYVYISVQ